MQQSRHLHQTSAIKSLTTEVNIAGEDEDEELVNVNVATFETALEQEEPDPADYGVWVPGIPVLIGNGLDAIGCADWLSGLILDGIVAGVGAVLWFRTTDACIIYFPCIPGVMRLYGTCCLHHG